jgi:hypothetical protein
MAMQTLITAAEVISHSQAGAAFPTDIVCRQIPLIEPDFGYECLGEDLYEWLLDNVEAVPETAREWVEDTEYAEGDFVVRNGCLFESLLGCNRNDPLDDPDETWAAFRKFGDNDCANEFWEHLRTVLALKVYAASLNYATRQTGANGMTVLAGVSEFNGQGFRSAGKNELADYKTDLIADTERAVRRMMRWAKKKVDAGLADCGGMPLDEMLNCNGLCKPQTNSIRRWGFRY